MSRFKRETAQRDGWSEEITPQMKGYKMACCDCGLVHDMDFMCVKVLERKQDGSLKVVELGPKKYRVTFRCRRNNRSTGQMRRHMKNEEIQNEITKM